MSLETLYNEASPNTYVGTIRTRQAAMAPTNQTLVNFLDGQPRTRSNTIPQDEYQREFTRNTEGQYKSGGAQGIVRSTEQKLTRWSDKSFKLAFDGEGPSTLANGYYTNKFRTDNKNSLVHLYTPKLGNRFVDANKQAEYRAKSSPSGAPTF